MHDSTTLTTTTQTIVIYFITFLYKNVSIKITLPRESHSIKRGWFWLIIRWNLLGNDPSAPYKQVSFFGGTHESGANKETKKAARDSVIKSQSWTVIFTGITIIDTSNKTEHFNGTFQANGVNCFVRPVYGHSVVVFPQYRSSLFNARSSSALSCHMAL